MENTAHQRFMVPEESFGEVKLLDIFYDDALSHLRKMGCLIVVDESIRDDYNLNGIVEIAYIAGRQDDLVFMNVFGMLESIHPNREQIDLTQAILRNKIIIMRCFKERAIGDLTYALKNILITNKIIGDNNRKTLILAAINHTGDSLHWKSAFNHATACKAKFMIKAEEPSDMLKGDSVYCTLFQESVEANPKDSYIYTKSPDMKEDLDSIPF